MTRNDDDNSVFLNFLAGVGIGAVVGAAAALLLAPKPGPETREDLKEAVDELRVKANKVVGDLSVATEDLVQKSREILDSTKSRLQNAVDSGRQAMAQKKESMDEETPEGQGA